MGLFALEMNVSNFDKTIKDALLRTGFVQKITKKQVNFTSAFKLRAVAEHEKGFPPEEIFTRAGIKPEWFPADYCSHCLKRWRKKSREQGRESLLEDDRGRPKKVKPVDEYDDFTVEELKAGLKLQALFIEALKKKKALGQEK